MTAFNIVNMTSGEELGRYYACNASDALDAMARYAGFSDFTHACESVPAIRSELSVTEL